MTSRVWLLLGSSGDGARGWHRSFPAAAAGSGRLGVALPLPGSGDGFLAALEQQGPLGATVCVPASGSTDSRLLPGPAAAPCMDWAPGLLLGWLSFGSYCKEGTATSLLF